MVLPKFTSGIYAIRNTISGRVYVGSSINIRYRWYGHRKALNGGKHHAVTLQRSWKKHGKDAFTFEVLELVIARDNLVMREQYWIDLFRSACPESGFNMHPTAGGARGYKLSAAACARASVDRLGKKKPPRTAEHCAAISAATRGKKRSPEVCAAMSLERTGRKQKPRTAEHSAAISAAKTGKTIAKYARTDAHRAAISRGKTGSKHSAESRAKMSAQRKGVPKSPEHTAKLRVILCARNRAGKPAAGP